MNDNERIAEFVDWMWDGREIKRKGDLLTACTDDGHVRYIWHPDTDIDKWHGNDGLLKKIEQKFWQLFCDQFVRIVLGPGMNAPVMTHMALFTAAIQATPAQLTAALVAVLKEEQDEN